MGCGKTTNPNGSRNSGCVCDVVRAILDIQNQAVRDECSPCTANCFLEPLGGIMSPSRNHADTRVFMLLTNDGSPFKAFFKTKHGESDFCTSVFFRVEDMFDDCCATLRVLEPEDHHHKTVDLLGDDGCCIDMGKLCDVKHWQSTESCITVDLSCFCAVQCIADVDLNICN
ncbi:CotZ [Lysinibacillus contaminans]|uniref:CotZ n=1 Tax=Lysinibacillus contaminans TaxID=1293441 RepID=A0ABR5JX44_9BACI|nr:CotY/CotZ family spore coat protein [Lysinibacillus contaminans]KOS66736.1 CotZ [Lysinibacillus contaminans]